MLGIGGRNAKPFNNPDLEIPIVRVPSSGVDSEICSDAAYENSLGSQSTQEELKLSRHERRHSPLPEHKVAGLWLRPRHKLTSI